MVIKGKNLFCVLFLAPAFVLYTGLTVSSICKTIYYSTLDWNGLGKGKFGGLVNFISLFNDTSFFQSVRNTIILIIMAVVLQNVIGFILAYMVSRIQRGYKFFRGTYFIPVVVTSAAVATIFVLFYSDSGPLNWFLRLVGQQQLIRGWLSDPRLVRFCVILPEIWQYTGTYFIIHLAGIQGVPADVIESARLDGASTPRILVKIIIPMMNEVVQVGVLFALINALKSFNFPWIMTYGGPGTSSAYLSVYMYKKIFQDFRYGYGSSMAVDLLLVLVVVTVIFKSYFNRITRDNE